MTVVETSQLPSNPVVESADVAPAMATALTAETGAFYFFSPTNLEVFVKVLDGRAVNGFYWLFYGGLTSLEYTVTVTDVVTGESRTVRNLPGQFSADGNLVAFQ